MFGFSSMIKSSLLSIGIAMLCVASANADLTTNGDFELGSTAGWSLFPTPNTTFGVTTDSSEGVFGGIIINTSPTSATVVKQANIGIGTVEAGDELKVSFDAKGIFTAGGVAAFEFFSEIDGGGVSKAETLLAPPTFLSTTYESFSFNVIAGPDVSGGVTFQVAAITGGAPGSTATVFIDNVNVSVVPEPTTAGVIGLALVGMVARRRRS